MLQLRKEVELSSAYVPQNSDATAYDSLPDFIRVSWVSDGARSVWEPRLARIRAAWLEIEWLSVLHGVRRCAVTKANPQAFVRRAGEWAARGLNGLPFSIEDLGEYSYQNTGRPPRVGSPFAFRIVIATPANVSSFKRAFVERQDDEIGQLLGYPTCCRDFFRAAWVSSNVRDTTWPMAAGSSLQTDGDGTREVGGSWLTNILWRWMGVRAVPHLPCSFECEASEKMAAALMNVGRREGYETEVEWIAQVLSWPIEWTALHGIAEIKTPILRVSTRTDSTAQKRVVRRRGDAYPIEGARGLSFPYQQPQTLRFTGSDAFKRGLNQVNISATTRNDEDAANNGFTSRSAMDQAHQPIVTCASLALGDRGGSVLDLGCGNGELLKKIYELHRDLKVFGIEIDRKRIDRARSLVADFSGNFHCGDFFDDDWLWANDRHYSLAILMPGRMLEVAAERAAALRQQLARHCDNLLLYGYGSVLLKAGGFETVVRRAGFRLTYLMEREQVGLGIVDETEAQHISGANGRLTSAVSM